MPHPLWLPNDSGAKTMHQGDRAIYTIDGRMCTVDEFLQDGDAFVTWDDGTFGQIKWHHLEPVS